MSDPPLAGCARIVARQGNSDSNFPQNETSRPRRERERGAFADVGLRDEATGYARRRLRAPGA